MNGKQNSLSSLKRISRLIFRIVLTFVALILLYFMIAVGLSGITINNNVQPGKDVAIYIKTNGVHTDLVMPVRYNNMDWSELVKFSNTILNDTTAQWLAIGWGDRAFYLETPTWADLKFEVAFRAAFGLSTSAIHATYYKSIREDETCRKIMISKEQYSLLSKYILNSFKKDAAGNVININTTAHYNDHDAFYEAKGKYSIFNTCNTWANSGLKTSGLRSCYWTPFDSGIFMKYK